MASPAEALAALIAEIDDLPAGLNIYAGPTPKITPPAVVIRPASDWLTQGTFCAMEERLACMPVVIASSPEEGVAMLRALSIAILNALVSPWDWESVSGPVIDETTGTPFLANRINLKYQGEQE